MRLVTGVEEIADVASLGVVMLLFLIGLELRPRRLWIMRRSVFGLGSAQVVVTAGCLAGLAILLECPRLAPSFWGWAWHYRQRRSCCHCWVSGNC